MEEGCKLPPVSDHRNLADSGGEEPRFTSDLGCSGKSGTEQQGCKGPELHGGKQGKQMFL